MLITKPIIVPKIKPKQPEKDRKDRLLKGLFWFLLGLFLLSLGGILFETFIKRHEGGEILGISDEYNERFRQDSAKLNHCVQYALLARYNGWYEKCDTTIQGKVYLYEGEIWKYGVTCEGNPTERYSNYFYESKKLVFRTQFRGNHLECEIEEKRKLYQYPVLPENLKRPENERLILPAGNCKRQ